MNYIFCHVLKKKLLILIVAVLVMTGCEKEKEKPIFLFGEGPAFFSFVDENGDDLLVPTHPNALLFESINLYRLENGEKKIVMTNYPNHPKGMLFVNDTINFENYRIGIVDFKGTMIIDFGSNNADTISYNEYNGIITYNGETVWDYEKDGLRHPIATIVK